MTQHMSFKKDNEQLDNLLKTSEVTKPNSPIKNQEFNELLTEAENEFSSKLKKYSDSVKDLLTLNDFNIQEKSMLSSVAHQGLVNCLFAERRKLKKIKKLKEEKIEQYIKNHGTNDLAYKTKNEAYKQEEIQKLTTLEEEQNELVQYLEQTCDIVKAFGFTIKNAVELVKLGNI